MKPVVLVIDDNPKVVESLILAIPDYDFLAASDGPAGLRLLEKPNVIDLVVLDYKLGELNGIEVLKKIRAANPHLPVIILTSFGSKEIAVGALRGRADDFADKPCDSLELKSKIDALLASARRQEILTADDKSAVQRVIHLIERNFDRDVTLEDAAAAVSLSPKYLSRKFRLETGLGFSAYKVNTRVRKAKELLRDSNWTVGRIADKVGYENAESFVKAFKKTSGLTPTAYRTQNPPSSRSSVVRA